MELSAIRTGTPLTEKNREILVRVLHGMSQKEIAADLAMQLFGVTTLLVALIPFAWGSEIAARGGMARWKSRLFLAPLAVLALAGGLSALPLLPRWPILYGHGGAIGDLAFQLVASIFGMLNPQRAGVAGQRLQGLLSD